MKKYMIVILCASMLFVGLGGCHRESSDIFYSENSRLELIAEYDCGYQKIYRDKETGVQYIYVRPRDSASRGWGSVLVDQNGIPLLSNEMRQGD